MKYMMVIVLLALCACDDRSKDQASQRNNAAPIEAPSANIDRIKVVRLSVFYDNVAYESERATYVITDTKTGKEYIGVSGIGIVESGSHICGRGCVKRDER